jgi:coproporphyrinogen III oxidase-like Fe-S oxidoreductase
VRSWDTYRDHVAAGRLPVEDEETVDADTGGLERAWLLLRTDRGWPLDGAGDAVLRLAEQWTERGLSRVADRRLRLTAEGWLLLDTLAVQMASAAEADEHAAALTA